MRLAELPLVLPACRGRHEQRHGEELLSDEERPRLAEQVLAANLAIARSR